MGGSTGPAEGVTTPPLRLLGSLPAYWRRWRPTPDLAVMGCWGVGARSARQPGSGCVVAYPMQALGPHEANLRTGKTTNELAAPRVPALVVGCFGSPCLVFFSFVG